MKQYLVAAVIICFRLAAADTECPFEWVKIESKCYKVFNELSKYEVARKWCMAFGRVETNIADLASTASLEENHRLLLLSQKVTSDQPVWIGLKSITGAEVTKWSDGSNVVYKNYVAASGTNTKTCYAMKNDGKWMPMKCDEQAYFACELSTDNKAECSEYMSEEPGVKLIKLNDGSMVGVYCDNGLTVIQSRGEKDFVNFDRSFEEYAETFGTAGKNTNFWLGLEKMVQLIGSGKQYNMVIQLCCGTTPGFTTHVHNIQLSDKNSHYILNGTATGNSGLNYFNFGKDLGSPFATYHTYVGGVNYCDVLNVVGGPVTAGSGGFWFGSCANNLNGYYYSYGSKYYKDPQICLLDFDAMPAHGTGVALHTKVKTDSEYSFDGVSWTRARIAIYPNNLSLDFSKLDYEYCSDFGKE